MQGSVLVESPFSEVSKTAQVRFKFFLCLNSFFGKKTIHFFPAPCLRHVVVYMLLVKKFGPSNESNAFVAVKFYGINRTATKFR